MKDYEKTYNNFWKDIVEKDGKLDIEQVKRELSDYRFLLQEVPKVYEEIAGLSYPNYPAKTILAEFNDRYLDKEIVQDDLRDIIKDYKTLKDLVEALKDYFEIS